MKKLTVFIKNGTTEFFPDKCIRTNVESELILKNATIYWAYKNVRSDVNDNITYGQKKITFDEGYWTFDAIKKKLKTDGIVIERNTHNNTCRIYPATKVNLHLNEFAPLIGFPETEILTSEVWERSPYPIDINHGLRYITIDCDVVNTSVNFGVDSKGSFTVSTLPVTSDQHLNGTTTFFKDIGSRVYINNGSHNKFSFSISTNISDKVDMSALLEFYIT
jgi:hypothetical protein